MFEDKLKRLSDLSLEVLESLLKDNNLPASERAMVAFKILEMGDSSSVFPRSLDAAPQSEPVQKLDLNFTNPKIFIHISAYRDPELIYTVQDAFKKAHKPENLFFGIMWQCLEEDESIYEKLKDYPCRILQSNARQSLGVCWARSLGQKLLQDEDFILQIDSHHRFVEGWDTLLLEMLSQCNSPKPLLTAYLPPYTPPDTIKPGCPPNRLGASKFSEHGVLCLLGAEKASICQQPPLGMFISGHFIFAPRAFYNEVPYDPFLYFLGEEITLSVRAWTKGWDIFYPHKIVLYHYYKREGRSSHWDVNPEWYKLERKSRERIKRILRVEPLEDYHLEHYDLGTVRTLDEYQKFSGVNFKTQEISELAHRGIPNV